MSAPLQDTNLFVAQSSDRARNFVKTGIWASISQDRLNNWIRQFEHYQAPLLGAVLLDNLIYKSKAQLQAMLSCLMMCPELSASFNHDHDLIDRLGKNAEPGVRIVPAISLSQPPTKSGFYVLRLLQRLFRIRPEWLMWPQQVCKLPPLANTLIVVDDFLGSGDQFTEFADLTNLEALHCARPGVRIVYLVIAAHKDGMDAVAKKYPFVEIICADVLTRDYHLFLGGRVDARYRTQISEQLNGDYMTLAAKAGLPLKGKIGPFGYGNLGLSYAFEHATPNNALPAYWYDTQNWKALLDR